MTGYGLKRTPRPISYVHSKTMSATRDSHRGSGQREEEDKDYRSSCELTTEEKGFGDSPLWAAGK